LCAKYRREALKTLCKSEAGVFFPPAVAKAAARQAGNIENIPLFSGLRSTAGATATSY
jgi:hypothetical protein